MVTPILPICPSGIPALRLISSQVSPPSSDRQSPLSGPPVLAPQVLRSNSYMAAKITWGLLGLIIKSIHPVFSLLKRIFSQV